MRQALEFEVNNTGIKHILLLEIMSFPHPTQVVYAELKSFFLGSLASALKKFPELNSIVVKGHVIHVEESTLTAQVCFPAVQETYNLPFQWFRSKFVHIEPPLHYHVLNLDEYMQVMHPNTSVYEKLERCFLEKEFLRRNGCAVLPPFAPLVGKKLPSEAKKKHSTFFIGHSQS